MRNFARAPLSWQRERWVLLGTGALVVLLVLFVLPAISRMLHLSPAKAPTVSIPVELPPAAVETASATPKRAQPAMIAGVYGDPAEVDQWTRYSVRSGQNLGDIFAELGIPASVLEKTLNATKTSRTLAALRPGEQFAFLMKEPGKLAGLQFDADDTVRVVLRYAEDGGVYQQKVVRPLERRVRLATGVVDDSLFAAGAAAGLSGSMILRLADIFGYDVDFAQDLREGDRFAIVYEEVYRDGEKLRDGDILAASFTNQGKEHHALRFARTDGSVEFFGDDGRSLRKSFLRTPVEFSRISSGFSVARLHPVLGTMRAHKGVDYAAPTGTPVRAAGDGMVSFRGQQSGYGNVMVLNHGNHITTLYGHLSRFVPGLADGAHVHQGQVIAYVGMTGLATGPHLHYEFRVDGDHRDPLKVTLPKAEPLAGGELAEFRRRAAPLMAELALLDPPPPHFASR